MCAQAVLPGDGGMRADEFFSRQRSHIYKEEFAFGGDLVLVGIKTSARRTERDTLCAWRWENACEKKNSRGSSRGLSVIIFSVSQRERRARALSSFGTSISAERAEELLLDVGVNARNLFL
jgi:hypothetical protein